MPEPLPLDQQLCFSLYAATIAINRAYKPLLDRLGLTYPQFLVLQALQEKEDRTVGRVAARLVLEPSTVTPIIKRLEAGGLVSRTRNKEDEREVRVRLTERGRRLWAETGCLGETMLRRSGMTLPQLADLNDRVRALRNALTESA